MFSYVTFVAAKHLVDQQGTLTLALSSNASVSQTARFTLNTAAGGA